jgi:hypothetical protein
VDLSGNFGEHADAYQSADVGPTRHHSMSSQVWSRSIGVIMGGRMVISRSRIHSKSADLDPIWIQNGDYAIL